MVSASAFYSNWNCPVVGGLITQGACNNQNRVLKFAHDELPSMSGDESPTDSGKDLP